MLFSFRLVIVALAAIYTQKEETAHRSPFRS